MKNSLLAIAITLFFSACKQDDVKINTAIIHAEIKNISTDVVFIMEDYETVKDTLKVVDGVINQEIIVDRARPYTFKIDSQVATFYIKPGDSISFTVDYESFDETINHTGDEIDENALLLELALSKTRPQYFKDAKKQLSFLDSSTTSKIKMIDDFVAKHPNISSDFVHLQKMIFYYYNADKKISYPWMIKYSTKKDPENLDDSFYFGVDTLSLENEGLVYNWEYLAYVNSYLRKEQRDKGIDWKKNGVLGFSQYLADTLESQVVQDYLFTRNISLKNASESKRDSLMDFINKNITTKEVLEKYTYQYNKLTRFKRGNPAPMWTAIDRDSITHSLKYFKGKWVYLDVWASWCKPCINEIPHMKSMEEKLKGKNIEFVSISIDSKSESWKKALDKYDLQGNQFILPKGKKKDFMSNYIVGGVPSFYLIDPDGNIYMKNPPRTSAVEKFDELMKEIKL